MGADAASMYGGVFHIHSMYMCYNYEQYAGCDNLYARGGVIKTAR